LAEFVFSVLLTWVKELPRLREDQRAHRWERYCGGELAGSTITIVGPGRIGREVGRIARAFGMHTIGVGARGDSARSTELGFDEYTNRAGLHAALTRSDAVVLATPHTPDTEHLIDAEAIAAMKPGICLVNIARGAVIDEDAMIAALQDGRIGFAGLDVFRTEPLPADSPLWDLPNAIITPHSASTAWRENQRITDIFTSNLRHFLYGRFDQMQPVLDKRRGY
jgi:phosphoglycerate dehydrogenase-like enzyme